MHDLRVAAPALDVVAGYVEVVDERGVRVAPELLRLVVTREAALARRRAVALDDVQVALLAGDAATHDLLVVEPDGAHQDVALGRLVAARAAGDGREFAPRLHPLEVAEEAGRLGDLEVPLDDDLGVAARAAEGPAHAGRVEVRTVVEQDAPSEGDRPLALEPVPGMTARSEAAPVLHDGERLRAVRLGRPFHHLRDGLVLDPERVAELGGIVALNAPHVAVPRNLPRLDIGTHDVAGVAERGAGAELPESGKRCEQDGEAPDRREPRPAPRRSRRSVGPYCFLWHFSQFSLGSVENTTVPPISVLPLWQAPQKFPSLIAAIVTVPEVPFLNLKTLVWQAVHLSILALCCSWLKVTGPGLSLPCGKAKSGGAFTWADA